MPRFNYEIKNDAGKPYAVDVIDLGDQETPIVNAPYTRITVRNTYDSARTRERRLTSKTVRFGQASLDTTDSSGAIPTNLAQFQDIARMDIRYRPFGTSDSLKRDYIRVVIPKEAILQKLDPATSFRLGQLFVKSDGIAFTVTPDQNTALVSGVATHLPQNMSEGLKGSDTTVLNPTEIDTKDQATMFDKCREILQPMGRMVAALSETTSDELETFGRHEPRIVFNTSNSVLFAINDFNQRSWDAYQAAL